MQNIFSDEENIKEYIERYQELILEYRYLLESFAEMEAKMKRVDNELSFIHKKLEENNINFSEYDSIEDFEKSVEEKSDGVNS